MFARYLDDALPQLHGSNGRMDLNVDAYQSHVLQLSKTPYALRCGPRMSAEVCHLTYKFGWQNCKPQPEHNFADVHCKAAS